MTLFTKRKTAWYGDSEYLYTYLNTTKQALAWTKELSELYYSARRWVAERTNSWHNRFRKLLVRYEKKSENYLALISLACCFIVYRRIILGRL